MSRPNPFARLRGGDLLAGLATTAVVALHAGVPGGWIGYDIGLALMGGRLTWELAQPSRTRPALGRMARLATPGWIAALILAALVAWSGISEAAADRLRGEALSSLIGLANVEALRRGGSDWRPGAPSALAHLWVLSVAAQVSAVWAGVALAVRRARGPERLGRVAAGLLGCSVAAGVGLLIAGAEPERLFYGPDVRATPFLLGALAATWPPRARHLDDQHLRARPPVWVPSRGPAAVAVAVLAVHLPLLAWSAEGGPPLGIALLVCLGVAVPVAALTVAATGSARARRALPVLAPPAVLLATLGVVWSTDGLAVTRRPQPTASGGFCDLGTDAVTRSLALWDALGSGRPADLAQARAEVEALPLDELGRSAPDEHRDLAVAAGEDLEEVLAAMTAASWDRSHFTAETLAAYDTHRRSLSFLTLALGDCPG